jgi:predicted DNA-binding transcriptional regulator AlpA
MSPDKLAGLSEVANLLGVSKNTALKHTGRADFPAPLDRLAAGPVWLIDDVEAWKLERWPLPTGRPPKN